MEAIKGSKKKKPPQEADSVDHIASPEVEIPTLTEDEQKAVDANISVIKDDAIDYENIYEVFGEDWDGSMPDMTDLVEEYAMTIAQQLSYNASVADFLHSAKGAAIDIAIRECGLTQVYGNINSLQAQFESLSSVITNFKSFGFSSGDIFSNADLALNNMEQVVGTLDKMVDNVDEILGFLGDGETPFDNLESFVDGKMDEFQNWISEIDIDKMFEKLPGQVLDKFLSLDIVQDLLSLPKRIMIAIASVVVTFNSIRSPQNLKDMIVIIKQLRSIVNTIKEMKETVEDTMQKVEDLANKIKGGNYIGAILSVMGSARFIEIPSAYNASYPYNQAYTTEGGHVFEVDNTKDSERLHVRHKSGSDMEIGPKGDMVVKSAAAAQMISEENMELRAKKGINTTSDGPTSFYSTGSMTIESTTTATLSADSIFAVGETAASIISAASTTVNSGGTTTISSGTGTSISCSAGMVWISSDTGIILDAPIINIGGPTTTIVTTNAAGGIFGNTEGVISDTAGGAITAKAGGAYGVDSGAAIGMNAGGTMKIMTGGLTSVTSGGVFKVIAPLISLN